MKKIITLFVLILFVFNLTACDGPPLFFTDRRWEELIAYYSDPDRYVDVVGVISHISKYNKNGEEYYCFDIDTEDGFDGGELYAKNIALAQKNGFCFEPLGTEKYIFSVIKVRKWGLAKPIASIRSEDGEITYLGFEEGRENIVDWTTYVLTIDGKTYRKRESAE